MYHWWRSAADATVIVVTVSSAQVVRWQADPNAGPQAQGLEAARQSYGAMTASSGPTRASSGSTRRSDDALMTFLLEGPAECVSIAVAGVYWSLTCGWMTGSCSCPVLITATVSVCEIPYDPYFPGCGTLANGGGLQ